MPREISAFPPSWNFGEFCSALLASPAACHLEILDEGGRTQGESVIRRSLVSVVPKPKVSSGTVVVGWWLVPIVIILPLKPTKHIQVELCNI